jgi:hypothetical protein
MIRKFEDFLKVFEGRSSYGDFKMKDFVLSHENEAASKEMYEDLCKHTDLGKEMDLPIGLEEVETINEDTASPSILLQLKYQRFIEWQNLHHSWKINPKEGKEFLEKIEEDFLSYIDEDGKACLRKKVVFYEAEAPAKLKKFAASWGYMVTLLFFYDDDRRKPMDDVSTVWAELIITFHKDEQIAYDNRGIITGRKFGL